MKKIRRAVAAFLLLFTVVATTFGSLTLQSQAASGTWVQNSTGWWYQRSDGTWPANQWEDIDGYRYYFDGNGYMLTGWQFIDGGWRYFTPSGHYIDNNSYEADSIKGIDVSRWQNTIDWQSVKNFGINFAMIRVGHGARSKDSTFDANIAGANAVGIHAGVYFYSTALSTDESLLDAQFVIQQLQGKTVSYPVAIDLEDATQRGLGRDAITSIAVTFCNEIRAAGYTPMVYCNETWAKRYIDWSRLDGVERWIARYNWLYNRTDYPRGIWQSSSTTRLPGINGNVDLDFAFKDYSTIVAPRTYQDAGYVPTAIRSQGHWSWSNGAWYYYDGMGNMTTGWQLVDGSWYCMDASGQMLGGGWHLINNQWYYMDGSGQMLTGWIIPDGHWYYLTDSGAMATGWYVAGGSWYFSDSSGHMYGGGWHLINNQWYYMDGSGRMLTGWIIPDGRWYYLTGSGAMATGWYFVGDRWYYSNASGINLNNQYVNGYWLDASGAWTYPYLASWHLDSRGWWYGDATGWYARNQWELIDGRYYRFDGAGYWR